MSETVKLDPSAIAVARTELDITGWIAAAGTGIDWGDAAIQAYTASVTVGEVRLHYRLPNRLIKIPLILRSVGATTFATIRQQLQAKVGLFQRENGWLGRTTDAGTLYADIQNATLHLGGSWLQAYRSADIDAVLSLECLPDWYGDEVTLSTHTETVLPHLFFTEPTINGNYPGRVRIVATNGTAVDQHGLLWGLRSRYYNGGSTAALFYEAETLQTVNGAAGTALAGASGGTAVQINSLPTSGWVSMLSTNMMPGTIALTHTGSYRVWARCYAGSIVPSFRLQWGTGSLSTPTTNDPVQLPGTGAFYLLNLGETRFDAPPVGLNQWFGVVQVAASTAPGSAAIDCVYLQPLDDSAGILTYSPTSSPAKVDTLQYDGTAADDSTVGAVAWANPGNAVTHDGVRATATLTSTQISHYLKATNFGFAIPSTATIVGVVAEITATGAPAYAIDDNSVKLVKAGTVQGSDRNRGDLLWSYTEVWRSYGSDSDLWGSTLAASDINNSGFGVAISVIANQGVAAVASVDAVRITVYYTLASGFTVAADAVLAASKTVELRTDGMYRQGGGGTIYGPVSEVIGDLPRVPPSGLESRTLQVFLKASRGEFNQEPDSAIDDLSAQIIYRPSFLYTE